MRTSALQLLRLSVAPVFFVLAWINLGLPSHVMHMGDMSLSVAGIPLSEGVTQALGSMWLMYVLMGIAHLTPWFSLFRPKSNGTAEF